jgi:DNA-binding NtrC family response regulator
MTIHLSVSQAEDDPGGAIRRHQRTGQRPARGPSPGRSRPDGDSLLVGRSPAIEALRADIARLGPTGMTVLILGETGTGKELVGRAVHQASPRCHGPFVTVNCATLESGLTASELFGHERGAFTGASERTRGLVGAADGGTLFLDEIGELSPRGQGMLLRLLQQREARAVGASQTRPVDVRVIAATNRDLARAILEKAFRADLYYRLSRGTLRLPPLRERREDVALLVDHFLAAAAREHGLPPPRLTPLASRWIDAHGWPGNVRELEHAIERAVVLARNGWIRSDDLQLPGLAGEARPGEARRAGHGLPPRQQAAVRIARQHGAVRRGDLVTAFGISRESAWQDLAALTRAGVLRRVGRGRGARYVVAGRVARAPST